MKETARTALDSEGFKSYLYEPESRSSRCFIVLLGDDGNDFMDKACARWITDYTGCAALCLAVRQKKDDGTGVSRWRLENVELALNWAKTRGFEKIGILGMSIQAAMALSAAIRLPDISLTLLLSPCDFVPWGFYHGRIGRASNAEWPSGSSAFCWRSSELPFQPAGFEKDEYWGKFLEDKKKFGEMHTISIFDESEHRHPIAEEAYIPAENLNGRLILVGAEDDSMWASCRYIRRLQKRLREKNFSYPVDALIYEKGTHLLVPENMLKKAVPIFGDMISKMFVSGRKNPKQCKEARISLEENLLSLIKSW